MTDIYLKLSLKKFHRPNKTKWQSRKDSAISLGADDVAR